MQEIEHKIKHVSNFLLTIMKNIIITHEFLLSVTILFSLYFSSSFMWSSSPLYYYQKLNYFYFHLLTPTASSKNCVFIICNGLVIFLLKTSNFVIPPTLSPSCNDDMLSEDPDDQPISDTHVIIFHEDGVHHDQYSREEEEEEEEEDDDDENEEETTKANQYEEEEDHQECSSEKTEQVSVYIANSDEVENYGENCWLFHDGDEEEEVYAGEEEEEDETEKMSTEELNQKFEEFIRRMKREIKINEASTQHQLLLVN